MNNIFKNAYFGKVYKTRDGKKAIFQTTYQNRRVWAMVDKCPQLVPYHLDGTCEGDECFDIISEWQEPIVCKCQWKDYYDYHIMLPNEEGHVRVSFFQEETIISDLFVAEEYRNKGYATILLDKVDDLLNGKQAIIYPLEYWQKFWYEKRGYIIGENNSIDEKKLDELAEKVFPYEYTTSLNASEEADYINDLRESFKRDYRASLKQ